MTTPWKKSIEPIIKNSLGFLFRAFSGVLKDAITIFVYHDVSDSPSEFSRSHDLNVKPSLFEEQIKFIKKNFNVISPHHLLRGEIPHRAALITFDDGFIGYFKNAIKILEKYDLPSIIFLNMGPIKGEVFWSGLITYLCDKRSDFKSYLQETLSKEAKKKPLFLSCSRDLVESYMKSVGESFAEEVHQFVGEFAGEKDLLEASRNPLVFYGNHSYNHYVPLLLSDEELLKTYNRNARELEKYDNYRNILSLPFGRSSFSHEQVHLLFKNGAKKIFQSSGKINFDRSSNFLDRIALTSDHDSPSKIWFQFFQRQLREIATL